MLYIYTTPIQAKERIFKKFPISEEISCLPEDENTLKTQTILKNAHRIPFHDITNENRKTSRKETTQSFQIYKQIYKNNLESFTQEKMLKLSKIFEDLKEKIQKQDIHLYTHCLAGTSRSPALNFCLLEYLSENKIPYETIFEALKNFLNADDPNFHFIRAWSIFRKNPQILEARKNLTEQKIQQKQPYILCYNPKLKTITGQPYSLF